MICCCVSGDTPVGSHPDLGYLQFSTSFPNRLRTTEGAVFWDEMPPNGSKCIHKQVNCKLCMNTKCCDLNFVLSRSRFYIRWHSLSFSPSFRTVHIIIIFLLIVWLFLIIFTSTQSIRDFGLVYIVYSTMLFIFIDSEFESLSGKLLYRQRDGTRVPRVYL